MQLSSVVSQRLFKNKKMSIYYRQNKKHVISYNTKGIFECSKCKKTWLVGDRISWLISHKAKKIKDGELITQIIKRVIFKKGISAKHEQCQADIFFLGYVLWVDNIENKKITKFGKFAISGGMKTVIKKYCETKKEQLILFKKLCKEYE